MPGGLSRRADADGTGAGRLVSWRPAHDTGPGFAAGPNTKRFRGTICPRFRTSGRSRPGFTSVSRDLTSSSHGSAVHSPVACSMRPSLQPGGVANSFVPSPKEEVMTFTRRQIITGGAAGVGLAVAGTLPSLESPTRPSRPAPRGGPGPFGGRPFPAAGRSGRHPHPPGRFSYTIASRAGETTSRSIRVRRPTSTTAPPSSGPDETGSRSSRTTS